jgi:hypothetical protein
MCGETFSSNEELEEHNGRVHGSRKDGDKREEKTTLE